MVWRDVFKDPITDPGKASKKGRVTLWTSGGEYQSGVAKPTEWTDKGFEWKEAMETYFENGEVKFTQTFDQVRANSNI
jgi:nicotinamide phosphoribosyltransferase